MRPGIGGVQRRQLSCDSTGPCAASFCGQATGYSLTRPCVLIRASHRGATSATLAGPDGRSGRPSSPFLTVRRPLASRGRPPRVDHSAVAGISAGSNFCSIGAPLAAAGGRRPLRRPRPPRQGRVPLAPKDVSRVGRVNRPSTHRKAPCVFCFRVSDQGGHPRGNCPSLRRLDPRAIYR